VAFFARTNAPNPFRGSTTVVFGLPRAADVTLRIYDIAGRMVRELVPERRFEPGEHQVRWDGRSDDGVALNAGVYFYQLVAGSDHVTRRMIRIR
jgi:flagellar hook assembly protein FlgD